MEIPNRKQRRALAKQMGLLKAKSKMPIQKQWEIERRASETGKEIHRINTENMLRAQDLADQERTNKHLVELVSSGVTASSALNSLGDKLLEK